MEKEWFETWFDSPYYHILYKDRNEEEATKFIIKLVKHLQISQNKSILDFACGKGRHSKVLHQLGMNVIGVDLSSQSIKEAKQQEQKDLKFYTHDIRNAAWVNYFDVVMSLFTSFGYFKHQSEDLKVLKNCYSALKKDGILVLDFFNTTTVLQNLVKETTLIKQGIEFNIRKSFDGKFIHKNIQFTDQEQKHNYTERVSCLTLSDFKNYAKLTGFQIVDYFGSYDLEPFNTEKSPRLILILKK